VIALSSCSIQSRLTSCDRQVDHLNEAATAEARGVREQLSALGIRKTPQLVAIY
jgi:hypothetical protein